jgi:hypothetical protein
MLAIMRLDWSSRVESDKVDDEIDGSLYDLDKAFILLIHTSSW